MGLRLAAALSLLVWGCGGVGAQAAEPPAGSYLAQCEAEWKTDEEMREYYPCTVALGFDPDLFFMSERSPEPHLLDLRDLVQGSLAPGKYGSLNWSFSVRLGCPAEGEPLCDLGDWRPILRAVTWRPREQLPADWKSTPIRSRNDARKVLSEEALWREADLTTCPGGIQKLLDLEQVRWMLFDEADRKRIRGEEEFELLIGGSANYLVRAGGLLDTTVAQDGGHEGGPGAWADQMMKLVEPCLRPLSIPAPWEY